MTTDNDIIKALECLCGYALKCRECPYSPRYPFPLCEQQVAKDALNLITRQKCGIVKQKCIKQLLRKDIKTAKSEAVKEFAEKVKKELLLLKKECRKALDNDGAFAIDRARKKIDNLVKEMVGENNG